MKISTTIYQIIVELSVLGSIFIGMFLSQATTYYTYYLLSIAVFMLLFILKYKIKFVPCGNSISSTTKNKPLVANKQLKNYSLSQYSLSVLGCWLGFLFITAWFFTNLINFGNLSAKTVNMPLADAVNIVQNNLELLIIKMILTMFLDM